MQRNQFTTDGFVVRRRTQGAAGKPRVTLDSNRGKIPAQYLIDPTKQAPPKIDAHRPPTLVRNSDSGTVAFSERPREALTLPEPSRQHLDLDMNLGDEPPQSPPGRRGKIKKDKGSGKKRNIKKIMKRSILALSILLIGFLGYFGYKFFVTGDKIFKDFNPVAAIFSQGKELQKDANGNTNVLLFGTSEDDPGHPGPDLTDSIMVASINVERKEGFVTSIPRDLHIEYGQACTPGYQGKVNALYQCFKDQGEEAATAAMRKKIGEIVGLDIQYSVHVNYTVLVKAVDAVGGITVNIESEDPRGILDRNFDWICRYQCYLVKYPNGPANLDGNHALFLARARGDPGAYATYGLSRSNPDRQDNQRKILVALKDKAVSAGVLTNPIAVNNLLDALGDNLRTNFDGEEVKTLIKLGQEVKSENILSFSLEDKDRPLATRSCFSGDICPNAGSFDYSAIQKAINLLATNDKAALEYATIDVLNASGTAGLATTKSEELKGKNLTVGVVGNAPSSLGTAPYVLYDLSDGKKPATLKKLESLLGIKVTSGTPAGVSSGADFVVIIGPQPEANDTSN